MKKLNIIYGASTLVSMEKSDFLNNKIIEFDTVFSIADLSAVDKYEIALPKDIYQTEINYSFKDKIKVLDYAIANNEDIRVWTSRYEINSYLLFVYICNYLVNKECNLYVVFSDEYDENCYSPSCMRTNELEELTKLEHKLSSEEISSYSNEWLRIKQEKSDMRILEDKKVKLVSYDYFDDVILNRLKYLGQAKVSRLTASLMANYFLSDTIIVFLINLLIKKTKIRIVEYSKERFFDNVIELNS